MEALRDMHLPPGFGFHPSDTELVSHYLKRKVLGQKIDDLIPEVDIYKHEPWDLPAKCNFPIEDNKWHFFASRDRKYPTGARSNRATIAGYWKSTGKDRAIKLNKRTLGTKKTLVFHEGRPPSGRRTEWIMHEYYIDENECQGNPDMKDAFVLCRVTKRADWALENDNEVGNKNSRPQQLNGTATSVVSVANQENAATSVVCVAKQEDAAAASVICPEERNHVATPVVSSELSNDAAMTDTPADTPNDDNELQAWLEELFDPSFNPEVDTGSVDPSLNGEHAESLNSGSMAPKMESDHASPIQNEIDETEYLLTDDIRTILYPGIDNFNNSMFLEPADQAGFAFATDQTYSMMAMDQLTVQNNFEDGIWSEELQLHQENGNLNLSNENADNGITVRRRHTTASAVNIAPLGRQFKMQIGIKRMVTSNSESINQTIEFANNRSHLDLMTNGSALVKQSDAAKSSEDHGNKGYFRGVKNAFRCSSAGFSVLFAFCMIGVAAVVLLGHHRPGISL